MRNLIFAIFWLLLIQSVVPAWASDRLIRVGGDHNYPPYEFLDENGHAAGFNVELTRAIAEIMGMEIEIRLGNWADMRQMLAHGEIDILQGMVTTQERLSEVDFSIPHAKVYQSIWVRDGSHIAELQDLAGKHVIVMRNAVMHDFMLQRPELNARITPVDTLEDALRALSAGVADAALVAKLPGEYLLPKIDLRNIQPIAKPLLAQDYGYAVKKGNRELLARFNEALALLKKSGRYQQLYEKWLGVLPAPGMSTEKILRLGALVLLPLLLVLIVAAFWTRTLSRQVALRTEALQQEVAEKERAMRELEIRQQQLIQADKLTSLGTLTSGVAHEINNPNGLILLNLPILKKAWQDAQPIFQEHYQKHGDFKLGWLNFSRMRTEIPQMFEDMQQGSARIKRIVEDLKDFARLDSSKLDESVDLNLVVQAALRLVNNRLRKSTDNFDQQLAENLPRFRGSAQRIEQVVVNLLLNACEALESKEQGISLITRICPDGDCLQLEICDQGRGIAEENLSKLTDPFFTTRRETGGTGLGLSISSGIVHDHDGRLEFTSTPGEGTCVSMILPLEKEQADGE
ncbi:amino acid-binding domain sensor histidine kinase [Malonomonas rubra DSM 5091]|uniref:histidine kinase n=1 Tax=Malonomonas rubra DSM 5091 TaxID=1122189 RepID=A0A1M6F4W7_MALRU|nr:transporter substrate-binding domain-containing protein [Malonomonas rubra]SHI92768.1 amino acid-binding domain sensor histidine kinase [Malonomonas rubra DSM 5091]